MWFHYVQYDVILNDIGLHVYLSTVMSYIANIVYEGWSGVAITEQGKAKYCTWHKTPPKYCIIPFSALTDLLFCIGRISS